ncbi:hypothetical protein HNY73_008828 [Argiope bruennichi]|uniref:Uncharacterized protein n=1 Tax=Argiope bruennichi TaxID=94029 RepID=A0A8T0F7M4_ARGBR|nr:hypothetical protein HNY73_008828 [Argiope bruennichi]
MRLLERLIYKFARKVKPQNTTRTGLIATSRILRRLQRVDHTHRSKLRFVSEVTERKTEEITNSVIYSKRNVLHEAALQMHVDQNKLGPTDFQPCQRWNSC